MAVETATFEIVGVRVTFRGAQELILAARDQYHGFFVGDEGMLITIEEEELNETNGCIPQEPPRVARTTKGLLVASPMRYEVQYDATNESGSIRFWKGRRVSANYRVPLLLHAALKALVSLRVALNGGLMLHASAVTIPEGGLLFVGGSGAGKTTISAMFGNANVLDDETIGLTPTATGWLAHSTPFSGIRQLARPRTRRAAELVSAFTLTHALQTSSSPLAPPSALRAIVAHTVAPVGDSVLESAILGSATQLAIQLAWSQLAFSLNAAATTQYVRSQVTSPVENRC